MWLQGPDYILRHHNSYWIYSPSGWELKYMEESINRHIYNATMHQERRSLLAQTTKPIVKMEILLTSSQDYK